MNAYLDIFSDMLRLVTFQHRQRLLRPEFPELDSASPDRVRQARSARAAAVNYGNGQPAGRLTSGR